MNIADIQNNHYAQLTNCCAIVIFQQMWICPNCFTSLFPTKTLTK